MFGSDLPRSQYDVSPSAFELPKVYIGAEDTQPEDNNEEGIYDIDTQGIGVSDDLTEPTNAAGIEAEELNEESAPYLPNQPVTSPVVVKHIGTVIAEADPADVTPVVEPSGAISEQPAIVSHAVDAAEVAEQRKPASDNGGGGGDVPPDQPAGGEQASPDDSPEGIRLRCLKEVEDLLTSELTRLASGESDPFHRIDRGRHAGALIAEMAVDAAQSGNVVQADAYIQMLVDLPKGALPLTDTSQQIYSCVPAIKAGSQQARDLLHSILASARQESDTMPLYSAVKQCEANDLPPDDLIENYAPNDGEKWLSYLEHYGRMAERGATDADKYQLLCNLKAKELLDESKYPAEFVYGETATALAWANDPEVRSQLMENFLWSAAKISAEQPMPLQPLLHVGFEIVKDPAMTEGPWVEMLARVIDEGVAKMVESGADVNQADAYLQRWRYSLAKHRGATPEELRDAINGQAGNLLRADPEDKATVQNFFGTMKHSEVTVMYRDLMLRQFAEEYAEEGDFGAARLMLADISDANDRLRVIKNCAAKATTSEQIDVLYPGKQIAGDVDKNWETDLAVYLAKVELSGDSRLLIQAAVRCAETISDEGSMPSSAATKPVFIRVAHRLLNERDPRQAAVLARQVLPHLRAANVADITPAYFADLSRTLIRSGDTEEPARAYRHIKHYASQPQAPAGSEVLNLWELARMLR